MDEKIVHEILDDWFASLEALDTQSTAVLQFLKDKGIANEEELASHLEQAGKRSSVKWLAVRVRMNYLLSSVIKAPEQDANKESSKPTENRQEAKSATKQLGGTEAATGAEQVAANGNPGEDEHGASVEKGRNQPSEVKNIPSKNAAGNVA
jgi:hypothetical protein